jgi:hypothetical protein
MVFFKFGFSSREHDLKIGQNSPEMRSQHKEETGNVPKPVQSGPFVPFSCGKARQNF